MKLYSIFIGSKDQAVALAAKDAILKTLKPKDSRRYSTHQVPAVNAAQKMFSVKPEKSAENSQSQLVSLAGHGMPDLEGEEESDTEHEEAHQQHADQQEQLSNQNMEEMLGELQMVWQMVEPHLAGAQLNQFIENPANLQQVNYTTISSFSFAGLSFSIYEYCSCFDDLCKEEKVPFPIFHHKIRVKWLKSSFSRYI